LPVYFRVHGVSLKEIGMMSLLGTPWTLKVLWAPLVDRFGTRQRWIAACLTVVALVLAVLPIFPAAQPTAILWAVLFVMTMASATQDIAIDAYAIELLGKGEEGVANGVRVSAYRAALIVGGAALVALAGSSGWAVVHRIGAGLALGLAVIV